MKLISCHIDNFGKLSNVDFNFNDGLNTIIKDNGYGKSTLCAFLCSIFYGLDGSKKHSLLENERARFTPWNGGTFGGNVIFENSNKKYIVTRIFKTKESEDIFEIRDFTTNLISSDYTTNIGFELFGIDRESFLRTICIKQSNITTKTTDDINSKIGNITDNTNDLNNYENAVNIIDKGLNSLNPKRKTGSISKRKKDIIELEISIKQEKELISNIKETDNSLNEMRENLDNLLKTNNNSYKREAKKILNYAYTLANEKNISVTLTIIGFITLVLATSVLFIQNSAKYIVYFVLITGLLLSITGLYSMIKCFNKKKVIQTFFNEHNLIYSKNFLETIEDSILESENVVSEEKLTQINYLKSQIKLAEKNLAKLHNQLDTITLDKDELCRLKEIQAKEMEEYRLLSLTKMYLTNAKEALTTKYTGPILESFNRYYSMIDTSWNGRFFLDANLNITYEEYGMQHDAVTLSCGIGDLVNLALRISFIDAMYKQEQPFIIMDDPFVNFDDPKMNMVKDFLLQLSKRYQIIYLTCSKSRA